MYKNIIGQAIIFCHTRRAAAWLAENMHAKGYAVDMLTTGLRKFLITMNVLSRGINVDDITVVVNFDLPMDITGNADCETYLHRIGRTGQVGKNRIAVNLIGSEKAMII
uniref:Helicase C-terminal domain-containing protein n=1 Tax=Glossina brevipalpis TaxID=37001 RepID=A0A1A9X5N7_9MUSC